MRKIPMLIIMLSAGLTASPEQNPCETASNKEACYTSSYASLDRQLNSRYNELRTLLNRADLGELEQDEIRWIRYKDLTCREWLQSIGASKLDVIRCFANTTQSRLNYLVRAYPPSETRDFAGEFLDGWEGFLHIGRNGNRYSFELFMSGSNGHTGHAEGSFETTLNKVLFSYPLGCTADSPDCCRLEFSRGTFGINVREISCAGNHGTRVILTGFFRKTH